MKSSLQKRRSPNQASNEQEILNAKVEKVIVVRRGVVAELRAVEDRVRRLGIDVWRLSPRAGRGVARALAATREVLRTLDFEDVEEITAEDMLRVLVGAVRFAEDVGGVLGFCERIVRECGLDSRGDGEGFARICTALGLLLPGAEAVVGAARVNGK